MRERGKKREIDGGEREPPKESERYGEDSGEERRHGQRWRSAQRVAARKSAAPARAADRSEGRGRWLQRDGVGHAQRSARAMTRRRGRPAAAANREVARLWGKMTRSGMEDAARSREGTPTRRSGGGDAGGSGAGNGVEQQRGGALPD
ncbi:hypothetical protein Scep_027810 [Stephania cephalantha]|uniref:Uncharacterized protein n=1 Tax=Stephania cephalantha TaxID=152367 RepID=A0AAP0EBW2_9MAGN